MPARYPVIDVTSWLFVRTEPGGRAPKMWLSAPDDMRWLFKSASAHDGRRQGEDWAEKLAAEVAALLGVPAARVDMATRGDAAGCISRDLLPDRLWEMQEGGVLVGAVDPRFVPRSKRQRKAEDRIGHSLDNIRRVLAGHLAPLDFTGPQDFDAFDVFCGYLVLDALIANLDRHEDNWAVLREATGAIRLAASYDHGSSLGYGLSDAKREMILAGQPGIGHWAGRGCAVCFEGSKKVTLVDFAASALRRARPPVRDYWRSRVAAVGDGDLADLVAAMPEMSGVTRRLCLRLLEVNRRRVLDGC